MDGVVANVFGNLFNLDFPSSFGDALEGIDRRVTEEMSESLDGEPTGEEIKEDLFQMHPNKSPGLYGMHALYFQNL